MLDITDFSFTQDELFNFALANLVTPKDSQDLLQLNPNQSNLFKYFYELYSAKNFEFFKLLALSPKDAIKQLYQMKMGVELSDDSITIQMVENSINAYIFAQFAYGILVLNAISQPNGFQPIREMLLEGRYPNNQEFRRIDYVSFLNTFTTLVYKFKTELESRNTKIASDTLVSTDRVLVELVNIAESIVEKLNA